MPEEPIVYARVANSGDSGMVVVFPNRSSAALPLHVRYGAERERSVDVLSLWPHEPGPRSNLTGLQDLLCRPVEGGGRGFIH